MKDVRRVQTKRQEHGGKQRGERRNGVTKEMWVRWATMRGEAKQQGGGSGRNGGVDRARTGRAPEQYSVFGKSLKMEHRYLDN